MSALNFDPEANSDVDFFSGLARRSNLEQLFGVETYAEQENETLKYQRPKQTMVTSDEAAANLTTWNTELAKISHAFKAGESVGKVGVALLKNNHGELKIILYKTKTNVLATLTLNVCDLKLYKRERYLQFYDDERHYWSLNFDKNEDEREFVKKLEEFSIKIEQVEDPKSKSDTQTNEPTSTLDIPADNTKSSLISRMAKMGQQLPKFTSTQAAPATATEYSDSSDTEVITTPLAMSHKPAIAPRGSKLQSKTQIVASNIYSQPQASSATTTLSLPAMEGQFLHMLLTSQNTEMRMNISKLEGKIEKVLDKIDSLPSGIAVSSSKEDELLELEEKLLELKKENRKLKQSLESRAPKSEGSSFERFLSSYKNDLDALDVEVGRNLDDLSSNLIVKAAKLQADLKETEKSLQGSYDDLKTKETQLKEEKEKQEKLLKLIKELENAVNDLNTRLVFGERIIEDLEIKLSENTEKHSTQLTEEKTITEAAIKTIMNNLYGSLSRNLEEMKNASKDQLLLMIGRTIRAETKNAIAGSKK